MRVRDQLLRYGAADAAAPLLRPHIEVAHAPMQRGGVVLVMGLRADRNQGGIGARAPEARQFVPIVARAVPSLGQPAEEMEVLPLRRLAQSGEVVRQRPDPRQYKAHHPYLLDGPYPAFALNTAQNFRRKHGSPPRSVARRPRAARHAEE